MTRFGAKLPIVHYHHVFSSLIYIPLRKLVMPYDNDPNQKWKITSKDKLNSF